MRPGPASYQIDSDWDLKETKGKPRKVCTKISNYTHLDIYKKVSKTSYKSIYYK